MSYLTWTRVRHCRTFGPQTASAKKTRQQWPSMPSQWVPSCSIIPYPLKQIPAASHRHSTAFHLATARGRAKQPCFPDYSAVCWHVMPDLLAGLPVHGAVHPQCRQGQVSPLPAHATVLWASFGYCGFPASMCTRGGAWAALRAGIRGQMCHCCCIACCLFVPACSSFTFRIKREPETLDASGMPEFLYG